MVFLLVLDDGWVRVTSRCSAPWLSGALQSSAGNSPIRLTLRNQCWAHNRVLRCCFPFANNKPACVDVQLASPDVRVGLSASDRGLVVDAVPGSPVPDDRRVTEETVSTLCGEGNLAHAVEALGVLGQTAECRVSKSLCYAVLKECVVRKDLVGGRRVHALAVKEGYQSDTFLANHILRMYASLGSLQEAMDVFTVVPEPDTFIWYSIISAHVKHGLNKQAIQLYHRMRRSGVKPHGSHVFVAALQACARGSDLKSGQQVHADVVASGVELDLFVCTCLVDMYAKCGNLEDARGVFDGLGRKNVVTWNAIIAGYSQHGRGQEALRLYRAMQDEGIVEPNSVTFLCLLQACASVGTPALENGKQLHAQIKALGHQADVFVASSLVNMYAKCGSLGEAYQVFNGLGRKDVVTWNAMIAGYSQQSMGQEALQLYRVMQDEGIVAPNAVTFVCLLQACASVGSPALGNGKQLHAQIRECGHEADVFVANSLVNMYAKCGSLGAAQRLFDELGEKDVVTWTVMIAGYSQQGMGQEALHLYRAMQAESIAVPDPVTFLCLVQACASVGSIALETGKQLHKQIREHGHQGDVYVASSLVNMYAKCGNLEDAQSLFEEIDQKTVVTWTAMIAGYSQQGMGHEALRLYSTMQEEGITVPDSVTFVCLLRACAIVGTAALEKGRQLHTQIREQGHEADVFVANSLVNMYAKCGSLGDAQGVFDGLGQKDVVTWNAMIAAYSQQGMGQEALRLHTAMQQEGIVVPDSVTLVTLLQACTSVGTTSLEKGKQLHTQIREQGLEADVFVASSLVSMYSKCGSLEDAQSVFDGLVEKDVVTWNAMIAGYAQQGMGQEALRLYGAMQEEGMTVPDSLTFVCLLQSCANLAALYLGRQIHAQIVEQGLQADMFVANSLVNMYAKCGSMVDAQQVFDALSRRDVLAWNALIAGYTCQGDSDLVFDLVHQMEEDGIWPDSITFLCVLTVCSHAGLVNKGQEYFAAMSRCYDITPTLDHYTCMVDLLGRTGQLDDALALVCTMPDRPNSVLWHTLLGACQKWGNLEVGRHAFNEAVKLDKQDSAAYVLMSNIYTGAQMLKQAQELQARRTNIRALKRPGQSWWTDREGLVHSFVVNKHPETQREADTCFFNMESKLHGPHLPANIFDGMVERKTYLVSSKKLAMAEISHKTTVARDTR